MALMTTLVLCARSQVSLLSVLVRRVRRAFSVAEFKDGRKARDSAPMAWDRIRLSVRDFLDPSLQRGVFKCLRTRLSSATKSSSRKYNNKYLRIDTDSTKS